MSRQVTLVYICGNTGVGIISTIICHTVFLTIFPHMLSKICLTGAGRG